MSKPIKSECILMGGEWIPAHQVEALQTMYRAMLDAQTVLEVRGIMTADETGKALAKMVNFFRSGNL